MKHAAAGPIRSQILSWEFALPFEDIWQSVFVAINRTFAGYLLKLPFTGVAYPVMSTRHMAVIH